MPPVRRRCVICRLLPTALLPAAACGCRPLDLHFETRRAPDDRVPAVVRLEILTTLRELLEVLLFGQEERLVEDAEHVLHGAASPHGGVSRLDDVRVLRGAVEPGNGVEDRPLRQQWRV